ncbi:hypothetical protein LOK74_10785 [Brevibacillus humidisoli]|uniref:hypothetical protein n=1 Tax=Brevibacillus humidisoli TaxID=2895522 RepID=UPI001E64D017|nr:hypothetical protein [Brevibacillus humidisoli]UFJ42940.1 hypothetical protein LOK74_10785 [Brevibacillus humidisoli]
MKNQVWQIAGIFAFSSVGASYLGGWEVLHFFSYYGSWGMLGLVLASYSLAWAGYQLIKLCQEHEVQDIGQLLTLLVGHAAAPAFSIAIHLIVLLLTGGVMAQLAEKLQAAGFLSFLAAAALMVVLVWQFAERIDWQRLIAWISWLPIVGIVVHSSFFLDLRPIPFPSLSYQLNLGWLWSALQYIGLHLLVLAIVAIMLAKRTNDNRSLQHGVIWGGGIFALLLLLGHLAILSYWHDVHDSQTPLYEVFHESLAAGFLLYQALDWLHALFTVIVWLYCLTSLLSERFELNRTALLLSFCGAMLAAALLCGSLDPLVPFTYVAATFLGLILFFLLLWRKLRA